MESHYDSLLEYPQSTRPAVWRGRPVPDVLLTGHHENVRRWRREQAVLCTLRKRPELLASANLTQEERRFVREENKKTGGTRQTANNS